LEHATIASVAIASVVSLEPDPLINIVAILPNQMVRKKPLPIIEAEIVVLQVTRAKSVRTTAFLKCWQCSVPYITGR